MGNGWGMLLAGLAGAGEGYLLARERKKQKEKDALLKQGRALSHLERLAGLGIPYEQLEAYGKAAGYPDLPQMFSTTVDTTGGMMSMTPGERERRRSEEGQLLVNRMKVEGLPGYQPSAPVLQTLRPEISVSTWARLQQEPEIVRQGVMKSFIDALPQAPAPIRQKAGREWAEQLGVTLPEVAASIPMKGIADEASRVLDALKAREALKPIATTPWMELEKGSGKFFRTSQGRRPGQTDPGTELIDISEEISPPPAAPPPPPPGMERRSNFDARGRLRGYTDFPARKEQGKATGEKKSPREDNWLRQLKSQIPTQELAVGQGWVKSPTPDGVRKARNAFESQKRELAAAGYDVAYIEQNLRLWESMAGVSPPAARPPAGATRARRPWDERPQPMPRSASPLKAPSGSAGRTPKRPYSIWEE